MSMKKSSSSIQSLQEELRAIREEATGWEAKCYRILNEPVPDGYKTVHELKRLLDEEKRVLEVFGKEEGDVCKLYQEYMGPLIKQKKAKDLKLKIIHEQYGPVMRPISHEETEHRAQVEIQFDNFKQEFEYIRNFFNEFTNGMINHIRVSKENALRLIQERKESALEEYNEAKARADAAEKAVADIKEEREQQFQELKKGFSIQTQEIMSDLPENKESVERIQNIARSLLKFKDRIDNLDHGHTEKMNAALDEFAQEIVKVQKKFVELRAVRKDIRSRYAIRNFGNLVKAAIANDQRSAALREAIDAINEEQKEAREYLEKHRAINSQIVPGTGKTVREVRHEIWLMQKALSKATIEKNDELIRLQQAEIEINKKSAPVIEKLEDAKKE